MRPGQWAHLRVEGLEIRRVCRRVGPAQYIRGPGQQWLLPVRDRRGRDPERFGQFRPRRVAFDRRQCPVRLTRGPVIPSWSFQCLAPLVRHLLVASVKSASHFAHCPNFQSPLLVLSGD